MTDKLPLGSVIKLKEVEKPLMIYKLNQENNGELYDYVGIPYPLGYLNEKLEVHFNSAKIEEIYFIGYLDPQKEND